MEKELALRLDLIVNFAKASQDAVTGLNAVKSGIEGVKEVGATSNLAGLSALDRSLAELSSRIDTVASRVASFGTAIDGAEKKVRSKKAAVDAAAVSTANLGKEAATAAADILGMAAAMATIDANAIVRAEQSFKALSSTIRRDINDVHELAAAINALPRYAGTHTGTAMVPSSAIAGGHGWTPATAGQYYAPPMYALSGGSEPQRSFAPPPQYMALPGGRESQYGPSGPMPQRGLGQAALTAEAQLALTGGVDPYYNNRMWNARQRQQNGNGAGSGPPIAAGGGFGPGGGGPPESGNDWGHKWRKGGGDVTSLGYGMAVNGAMAGDAEWHMVKSGMNIESLQALNSEAIATSGGSEQIQNFLNKRAVQASVKTGTNFSETVGGMYNMVSAMPDALAKNGHFSQESANAVADSYDRVAKLAYAGGSSKHPLTMKNTALDVNATIENMGFDVSTPQKYAAAIKEVTNGMITIKNRTASEVDLIGSSIRAIGPQAAKLGESRDVIWGYVAAEASGKMRGAPAGMGYKRLDARQYAPPKKLVDLQKMVTETSHGALSIDLFDKKGKARSLLDVVDNMNRYEEKYHLTDKQKGYLESQLSGLYAAPQLGLFARQVKAMGGKEGFKAYGRSFSHETVKGKDGKRHEVDSTERYYNKRVKAQPVKTASDKLSAEFQAANQNLFKVMTPDLLLLIGALTNAVKWFDGLSAGVKHFVGVGAGLFAIFNIIGGAIAIVGGNIIRTVGGFKWLIDSVKSLGPHLAKLGPAFNAVRGAIAAVGPWLLRLIGLVTPIGWAITAVTLAIGLLATAWTRDWGNIRENTAATNKQILDGFKWLWGGLQDLNKNVIDFAHSFGDAARNMMTSFIKGLTDGMTRAISAVKNFAGDLLKNITGGVSSWVGAGAAIVGNIARGVTQNTPALTAATKAAAQKSRDLLPGSEPKASDSPLARLDKAGAAIVGNTRDGVDANAGVLVNAVRQVASASADEMHAHAFIDAAINHTKTPKPKKAKHPRDIADSEFTLKPGETIAQIVSDAAKIEDAMERVHGHLHKKMILLRQGRMFARIKMDPGAVRDAITDDKAGSDLSAQHASDYLKNTKRYKKSYEEEMKALSGFLISSHTAHARAAINGMIGTLEKQHQAAMTRFARSVSSEAFGANGDGGKKQTIQNEFTHLDVNGANFADKVKHDDEVLQRYIETRKNKELPTMKELQKERALEQTEQEQLEKIHQDSIRTREKILSQMEELFAKSSKITGNDKESLAIKAHLTAQLQAFGIELVTVNNGITKQEEIIGKVAEKIGEYDKAIATAKDHTKQWAEILSDAFDKAATDSIKSLETTLQNGIDGVFSRIFGAKKSGLKGIVGSFFADLFGNVANTIIGGVAQTAQSQIMGLLGGFLGGKSKSSSEPTKATITTSSGVNVTDEQTKGISTTAKAMTDLGGVLATAAGGHSKSSKAGSKPGMDAAGSGSLSDSFKAYLDAHPGVKQGLATAVGLATAIGGYQQGGFGGAVAAAAGVESMFSGGAAAAGGAGPYAAAAAFLITILSHQDNPGLMPDKYNTGAYGQLVSNLNGAPGLFNGSTIAPQQQYDRSAGNKDLAQQLWDLAQNPSSSMTDSQRAVLAQLKALGGSNGDLGIKSMKDNVFTLGSGATIGVNEYTALIQQGQGILSTYVNPAIAQQQNADRLAASFSSLILGGPAGFSMPALIGGSMGSILGGGGSSGRGGTIGLPGDEQRKTIIQGIHLLENVTTLEGDPKAIAQAISDAIPLIRQEIQRTDYQESRRYTNYAGGV